MACRRRWATRSPRPMRTNSIRSLRPLPGPSPLGRAERRGSRPADLVFGPTSACGDDRRPSDGFAPSPGEVSPTGAGLTSKPRHAHRPRVGLRGSLRPRLASTAGDRFPGATTDPDASPWPSIGRGRRAEETARAAVSSPTAWAPASSSTLAHAPPVAPVVSTSSTSRTRPETPSAANTPRIASRRAAAPRRACGPGSPRRRTSGTAGTPSRGATARASARAWSYPRAASRSRDSGTHVTALGVHATSAHACGHRAPERVGDGAPSPELQPVDRTTDRSVEPERRAGDRDRVGRTVPARGDRTRRRRPASLAPRRREHHELGPTRVAERPRPRAAARAPLGEQHVEQRGQHARTLSRAADTRRYGRGMSTDASEPLPRPLSSTRRDPSVRING